MVGNIHMLKIMHVWKIPLLSKNVLNFAIKSRGSRILYQNNYSPSMTPSGTVLLFGFLICASRLTGGTENNGSGNPPPPLRRSTCGLTTI